MALNAMDLVDVPMADPLRPPDWPTTEFVQALRQKVDAGEISPAVAEALLSGAPSVPETDGLSHNPPTTCSPPPRPRSRKEELMAIMEDDVPKDLSPSRPWPDSNLAAAAKKLTEERIEFNQKDIDALAVATTPNTGLDSSQDTNQRDDAGLLPYLYNITNTPATGYVSPSTIISSNHTAGVPWFPHVDTTPEDLQSIIEEVKNRLAVGLDPDGRDKDYIPSLIDELRAQNRRAFDHVKQIRGELSVVKGQLDAASVQLQQASEEDKKRLEDIRDLRDVNAELQNQITLRDQTIANLQAELEEIEVTINQAAEDAPV